MRWNALKIVVGKPEYMNPLGRPIYRGIDNIDIDLKETCCKVVHRLKRLKLGVDCKFLCTYKTAKLRLHKSWVVSWSVQSLSTSKGRSTFIAIKYSFFIISPIIVQIIIMPKIHKNRIHYKPVIFLTAFIIWCPEEHDTRNCNKIAGQKISLHVYMA
jgi:hypothetical protein